eukprot:CAMPEP_0197030008 /NCGR_PEP_ID=MMETSP1384-20130603/9332_1 /TAXON_ID=29189 /ORGANISM="Ammonia sp." /LENGTH=250 /DNA_ID=CAMNT_0042459281 /DNA_START=33 /DNA_END=785 /DNA_ORIENTATION=+
MASFSDELQLMEGVNNLRNQFRQTFDCLSHLQFRLESQIDSTSSSSINPITLSQRISKLQKSLAMLESRANVIANKKQTLIPKLIDELTQNCLTVHELRCKSGLKTSGIPENILMDFHDEVVKYQKQGNGNEHDNSCMYEQNMSNEASMMMSSGMHEDNEETTEHGLSEDRFNNLSSSTKQRVSFEQLQEAYEAIKRAYFNQNKKPRKAIAIKTLADCGVTLTGLTGQSIVNCLRSLKLIKQTKNGIVCI